MFTQVAFPARLADSFPPNQQGASDRGLQVTIRRASKRDQDAVKELVRSERLNPTDLDWRRFWVAIQGSDVVGAAQIRRHRDSSREVSSLVVARSHRHRGIAARLLDAVLTDASPDHYLITGRALAAYYERWGFKKASVARAPRCIRRNYWLGQIGGFVISCIKRRMPRRLVIMHRVSARPLSAEAGAPAHLEALGKVGLPTLDAKLRGPETGFAGGRRINVKNEVP
jgi:amino-acid N-acetyltransferase